MWHFIWIAVKVLFWLVLLGAFYFAFFRVAVTGRSFLYPDMERVDKHFGMYESWNTWKGYAAYYFLFLMIIILPIVIAALFWLF